MSTIRAALLESYDKVVEVCRADDHWAFTGEQHQQRLALRVWRTEDDPSGRIPTFLDGAGRARHPMLATTVGARYFRSVSLLVVEQAYAAEDAMWPAIANNLPDPSDRLDAACGIAEALAYAHEHGWTHGALSPWSISVGTAVRLYDLGIGRLLGRVAQADQDIVDFFALIDALSPRDAPETPLRRWLDSSDAHRLQQERPSMRAVEVALAKVDEPTRRRGRRAAEVTELEAGTWIDHFQIQRHLGRGGLADVYLARDTVLGRLVALKLLRHDAVSEPETSDLLEEARSTAVFSHPNIVVLYGVGRHRRQVYLALEYLPGETLSEALKAGLTTHEAIRIGLAIARALSEAHRQGILHCDLKPANVLVPEDGRPRVVDFGLARAFSTVNVAPGRSWSGTPAYMAPEQWRGLELSGAVDVWALGLILYEMLEGDLPRRKREGPPLPPGLEEGELPPPSTSVGPLGFLVASCLRGTPQERPTADEIAHTLERLYAVSVPAEDLEIPPFRGLEAFDQRHARFFVGREEESDRFLRLLRTQAAITVVGASGTGKSSFVQAAVLPRLAHTGRWQFLRIRPGARPMRALAAQLMGEASRSSRDTESVDSFAARLTERPALLNLKLHDRAEEGDTNILVFVDQAEELITNVEDLDQAAAFLKALGGAFDGPDDSIRVVMTLRDDFLGRLAALPGAATLVQELVVLVSPSTDMLVRCVTAPLAAIGYQLSPRDLAQRMVDEVKDAASPLPLLQFTCAELWKERNEATRTISEEAYAALGGVQGALARRADQLMASMNPSQFEAAKTILLRLVGPEGTRLIRTSDALVTDLPGGSDALEKLVEGRLVTAQLRPGRDEGGATYELVHEALIRSWTQLARWTDETREERQLLQELEETVQPWLRRGALIQETWDGPTVERTLDRFESLGIRPPPHIDRFLKLGRYRAHKQKARERLFWTVTFAATALFAIVAGAAAVVFRSQAEQINQAAANLGRFDLVLHPFDIDPATGEPRPANVSELPDLSWRLHDIALGDILERGAPIEENYVRSQRLPSGSSDSVRYSVEVRGGSLFLLVIGRGRKAECGPSELRLQRAPGYAERYRDTVIEVWIPTCAASLANMAQVPAGEFISGGAGIPKTRFPSYVEPEKIVDLPAFAMDRYEVSNQALGHFTRMSRLTGMNATIYPKSIPDSEILGLPEHPAVLVGYHTAEAFCRFHGKRLPTSLEWEKAARGGIYLDEQRKLANPMPTRNLPWGSILIPPPLNISLEIDGYETTAPVTAFEAGASPYGILQLAGNVSEWTSTSTAGSPQVRIVRGGDWLSPPDRQHWYIAYENTRVVGTDDLRVGFRCARDL